jgi:hypothetical protein
MNPDPPLTARALARQLGRLVRGTYTPVEDGLSLPLPDEISLRVTMCDGESIRLYLREPAAGRYELTDLGQASMCVAGAGHHLDAAFFAAVTEGTAVRCDPRRDGELCVDVDPDNAAEDAFELVGVILKVCGVGYMPRRAAGRLRTGER